MNRRKSMRNTRHKNTNGPQKKYCLGMVSKNILLEGLNRFHGANLTLSSDVDNPIDWWSWVSRAGPLSTRRRVFWLGNVYVDVCKIK